LMENRFLSVDFVHCSSVLFGKVFRFAQGNFGKRNKKPSAEQIKRLLRV